MFLIDEYIRQNVANPKYQKVQWRKSAINTNTGFQEINEIFENQNCKLIVGFSLIIHTPAANTPVQFFDNFNTVLIDHPANTLMQQMGVFYHFWPDNNLSLKTNSATYQFTLGFQLIYQNSEPVKVPIK